MDHGKRTALIEKIKSLCSDLENDVLPVVSLEDFFVGNDDFGSIGCNLLKHPGVDRFFQVLSDIRDKPEVQDVLIDIYEVEEEDETMWPFSERVYILTSAASKEVAAWLSNLEPDDFDEGWMEPVPPGIPEVEESMKVCSVWWD